MDALLGELTSAQYGEWANFLKLEPTGGQRDDLRAALIVAALYNSNPYRDGKAILPADVFGTLRQTEPKRGFTKEEIQREAARAARWCAAYKAAHG